MKNYALRRLQNEARCSKNQGDFDYLLKPLQIQEVQLVLEKLAKKLAKKKPFEETNDDVTINPAFSELIDYVKKHFDEKFTLDQLAKQFGLSAGYICNLFAKTYNTTLTCFITKLRMEHAVELMKDKDCSLKNVAVECGYKDYFYFNKVFKGYYGVAPSQYMGNH